MKKSIPEFNTQKRRPPNWMKEKQTTTNNPQGEFHFWSGVQMRSNLDLINLRADLKDCHSSMGRSELNELK